MTDNYSLSDIAAASGNRNNSGMWGNDGAWWIVLFVLFGMFGWGNGGYGFGNGGGVQNGYALATDFANLERKIDGVNNGLCDGFYAQNTNMLNGFAGVQNTMTQGFAGLNTGIVQQGYETRLGLNGIQSEIANCCCTTQNAIKDGVTQGVMNTNAIQNQIQQCCCDNEKLTMQTQFADQQNHCATMTAIDKVGDRIIDWLANDKAQNLRDENQALRLAASQAKQNETLLAQIRPYPVPAFNVQAPYFYGANCGCGCGC